MSQKENDVHPVRRRAGLLSALAKLYTAVRGIVENEGTAEEALTVQRKLNERYVAYLECHEIALVAVPERENSLNESHIGVDQRHQEAAMSYRHTSMTGQSQSEACTLGAYSRRNRAAKASRQ